jgi:hypothetical protein
MAGLGHFLEKVKKDLPYYYLFATENGIWRKPMIGF